MIRWYEATLVGTMVVAATVTFWIKHDARQLTAEIKAMERREHSELTAIELHRADWSLLSQPDRLQELVESHADELGLRATTPDQLAFVSEIGPILDSLAPESIEDAILGAIGDADALDDVATGAVR